MPTNYRHEEGTKEQLNLSVKNSLVYNLLYFYSSINCFPNSQFSYTLQINHLNEESVTLTPVYILLMIDEWQIGLKMLFIGRDMIAATS